mgnify:CR=1 FL=1
MDEVVEYKRITADLHPDIYKAMEEIAQIEAISKASAIARALTSYRKSLAQQQSQAQPGIDNPPKP